MPIDAEKTPSAIGLYLCALLMALFGALLGFVYMSSFPAQAFGSQAEYKASLAEAAAAVEAAQVAAESGEPIKGKDAASAKGALPTLGPKPGSAHFIEGEVYSSRTWEAKRKQLSAAGAQSVAFSVGEMNAWMASKFRPGVVDSDDEEAANLLIVPGLPNLGIADQGEFYLNVPTSITAFGATGDFMIFARCALKGNQVKLRSVNVRSAKVPLPGILGARILGVLMQGFSTSEEYQIISEAFARADTVKIVDNQFVFELR